MKIATNLLIILILLAGIMAVYVSADAEGPLGPQSINETHKSTFNVSQRPGVQIWAQAGNLTRLEMHGISQTRTWQGYYGHITGTITLDDAAGNTMYDWYVANPQGKIYASNSSVVNWTGVRCLNYSAVGGELNLTSLESMFNIHPDDPDSVYRTFNVSGTIRDGSAHPHIYVGTKLIGAGTCPATDTYQRNSSDPANNEFVELLLTDTRSIIFTTIIENKTEGGRGGVEGFDGNEYDFQMLVLDDGRNGNVQATPYWFFVEIE